MVFFQDPHSLKRQTMQVNDFRPNPIARPQLLKRDSADEKCNNLARRQIFFDSAPTWWLNATRRRIADASRRRVVSTTLADEVRYFAADSSPPLATWASAASVLAGVSLIASSFA
jgi:hypothetical protein